MSADGGDAWKIKLRVKNGNDYRVKSTARVYEGGDATDSRVGQRLGASRATPPRSVR